MFSLTDVQKVSLAIAPVNAKGKPAPVDGVPAWTNSNEIAASLSIADDGLSAVLFANEAGTTQVMVSVDADMGEGVVPITGILDVQVLPSMAVSIAIVPGVPENQ
jgi:hypothetical protein